MKLGGFRYLVKQGWKNMAANRLMTLASIGVLTACLIITGVAMLLSLDAQRVVDYLGNQNRIVVYILEGTTAEEISMLEQEILAMPNVEMVEYVDKGMAFEELLGLMHDRQDLLQGYDDVLPASFRVMVKDLSILGETSAGLAELPFVDEVQDATQVAGALVTLKNAATYGGWALTILLGLVSIIIISNTIRLTVFARRREISIMKYVGATNAFIRLPFFVEGMTVGAISGALAAGVVCGIYYLVMEYLMQSQNLWLRGIMGSLLQLQDIWYWLLAAFVAFGILIGSIGTTSSIRKHLKV